MLSYPVSQPAEASGAPVGVGVCAQHMSPINVLGQGIRACGEDSCYSLLGSPCCVELVVAGH